LFVNSLSGQLNCASMAAARPTLDVGHAGCRDVLKMAAERLDWEVTLNCGGTIVWSDGEDDGVQRLAKLRRNDWLSWIPGMQEACGKIALAEALQARGATFWPRSWRVPLETEVICKEAFGGARGSATLIVKPDAGSQGCGISLAQSAQDLRGAVTRLPPEGAIVQEYIDQPMLLNGFKWDARIYVLMVARPHGGHAVFLEEEGLVRVCTETYEPPTTDNLRHSMVHLTNYSLNKFSDKYTHNDDPADATSGCKRSLSAVLRHLEAQVPPFSAAMAWQLMGELSRQTCDVLSEQLAALPKGPQQSRCFHLVGLDVLFDGSGRPWLLEANYRPSMMVDEVHPIGGSMSRAEVNKLMAAERRPAGAPKWGRPCRCSMSPSLHEHQICAMDVAAKLPAVEGAMEIVQRARAGLDVAQWSEGTPYRLV